MSGAVTLGIHQRNAVLEKKKENVTEIGIPLGSTMLAHYWGLGTKAEHMNLGYSLLEV